MSQGRPLSWYRRLSDRRGRLRFELVGELAAAFRTDRGAARPGHQLERRAGGVGGAAGGRVGADAAACVGR
jgi:hypothetical protein